MSKRKQDRGLVIGLVALALVFAGAAARGGVGQRSANPVLLEVDQPLIEGSLSIVWAGDTMIADGAQPLVEQNGYDWVFEQLDVPYEADVVVVNHEAPITAMEEPLNPNKVYSYSSDPVAARALASAGITVLGLCNNHALDMGSEGLADTMRHAEQEGLVTFGAGMNDREAERPLIVRGDGITVGIVALARGYGSKVTAGRARAGTIPLSRASIRRGYELARSAGADYVVAYVHWGANYRPIIDEQRQQARLFAEMGYDLVVGHGPHVAQPAEMVDGMPVFYSLGNFVFGAPGRFTSDSLGRGLVLTTEFREEGLTRASVECLDVDNKRVGYQPRPLDHEEAGALIDELNLSAITGALTSARE